MLSDVRAGNGRALVIRGEPGIGKSALLAFAADQLDGWQTARASGVESEFELAYSGLQQLCASLTGHLDALPEPQRTGLATAFGLSTGPAPDPFLVGVATLSLFAEASGSRPLACLVDDAQWLDSASLHALAFTGRRLVAEPVALVFSTRTTTSDDALAGFPELRLGGLGEPDARAMLLETLHAPVDARVRDRIIAECRGNPLALRELPRSWAADALAGGYGMGGTGTVASKVEQSFVERINGLPAASAELLAAAAAEPLGDPLVLHEVAGRLGIDMSAVDDAIDARLLRIEDRVTFAHPLARSAAYRSCSAEIRRRVHAALVEVTDATVDPDRRAWHRALASLSPDEAVAADLERSAGRAQARGGLAAAAAFLARAAELTPVAARRGERAVDAASAYVKAGGFDEARSLLALARAGPLGELQDARCDLVAAQLAVAASRGNGATRLLLAAAKRFESLDPKVAREIYLDAFGTAHFGARLNEDVGVAEVAAAARVGPRRPSEPTVVDLLLDAYVALEEDYATAIPACREALDALCRRDVDADVRLPWAWHGLVLALELWDDATADLLSRQYVDFARRAGALSHLVRALTSSSVTVLGGDLETAAALAAELRSVQEATGIATAPYVAVKLLAMRGDEIAARALIDETVRAARSRGEGIAVAVADHARAILANGTGLYEEALSAAQRVVEHRELVVENWGLSELVEAAARTRQRDPGLDALERLERKANATSTAWARGIAARSRAVLGVDGDVQGAFTRALDELSRTHMRSELARTHLLYGEWLRRTNRRVEARGELRVALEMFTAMGMEAFAERARRELVATGAVVRRREFVTRDDLTPHEVEIALLARQGLSNIEIGAKLFISARTVEWHLRKVFTKLGISSRRLLRTALDEHGRRVAAS